jgi:glycerophosphoryl diester phosphodiesterase
MRRLQILLLGAAVAAAAVYLLNASWRAEPPSDAKISLIAHRGVHQTFHREGLGNDTCTAARIDPPVHDYLENTIRSMQAAFAAGADVVELDVHPTTDGHFAVMHDWTLDCRTEGTGETRSHDRAYLKSLDIGHGYTADGGKTFPFRGKGVGQMPELAEVFAAMPQGRFLVNFKSNEEREGDMLADMISGRPEWRGSVWGAYGGDAPTFRAAERLDGLAVWSRRGLTRCLSRYIAFGWTGFMPSACRNTKVMIPINVAPWLWGWPNLLLERFHGVGSELILLGPYASGDAGTSGIDTLEQLAKVPPQFSGYLWTNKIELIGPALRGGRSR